MYDEHHTEMSSHTHTRQCQSGSHECVGCERHELRHRMQHTHSRHTASAHAESAAAHKRWSSSVFLASNSDSVMAPASSSFLSFMMPSCMVKGGEAGGFGGGYSSSTRDSGCGPPSGPASPWECRIAAMQASP